MANKLFRNGQTLLRTCLSKPKPFSTKTAIHQPSASTAATTLSAPLPHQPPRSLPHPTTSTSESFSDHEISEFYKALVSPPQPKPSPPSHSPELILKPNDLNTLLELANPADLDSQKRKHIIHNLSPIQSPNLSTLERHLQSISINILRKELPWYALLQSAVSLLHLSSCGTKN